MTLTTPVNIEKYKDNVSISLISDRLCDMVLIVMERFFIDVLGC